MKVPTRLPEPRPVLVATTDVASRMLRPRNLAVAAVVAAVAAFIGGNVGLLLGLLAAPLLLGVTLRTAYRLSGRGRTRRAHNKGIADDRLGGWATTHDIVKARPTGPSTRLGSTTVGPPAPVDVRVGHEASVLILGGPRMGKTLTLADIVRQHRGRGPRYISSTRVDLLRTTISAPKPGEAPAWVFIPEGVEGATRVLLDMMVQAGWIRAMRWSPLEGCDDAAVAANRAAALTEAVDSGDSSDQTWLQSATTVLRCLLHAAALGGHDMRDVYRWATDLDAMAEPHAILDKSAPSMAAALASEVLSENKGGAASVIRVVAQATEFIDDPAVAAACCPGPGDAVLDMRAFLESGETLYVVGRERKRQGTQPLLAALTTHLHDTAEALAGDNGGKLPRTLLLAADELAVTARVPWDDWLATAGGSGIHMVGVAQSPAQLRKKWPDNAIIDLSTSVVVFGGLKNNDDLYGFEYLCGSRWEPLSHDPLSHAERPVMPGFRLSGLPKFRALHVGGGLPHPTILATARWVKVHDVAATLRAATTGGLAAARHQITGPARTGLPPSVPIALPPAQRDRNKQEV